MDVYVGGKLDGTWADKITRLEYVEGKSWKEMWDDWVAMVIAENETRTTARR